MVTSCVILIDCGVGTFLENILSGGIKILKVWKRAELQLTVEYSCGLSASLTSLSLGQNAALEKFLVV